MQGLPNFGATCYANSVLQILLNADMGFTSDILSCEPKTDIAAKFRAFVNAYISGSELVPDFLKAFITQFFIENPLLYNGQQDQHEFLTALLSMIHRGFAQDATFDISSPSIAGMLPRDELESLARFRDTALKPDTASPPSPSAPSAAVVDSPVVRWFCGQFVTETTCQDIGCGYITRQYDAFRTIELPIENTVEETLSSFTKDGPINDYTCDKCKKRTVNRKIKLWRSPRILVLGLKRTIFSRGFPFKDERTIGFQQSLDLSPYFMRPLGIMTYNLVATADHVGEANSGHCFSYVYTMDGLHRFDDMRIEPVEGLTPSARQYLLVYSRGQLSP